MNDFRIEPPIERSDKEVSLSDDLFTRRATKNIQDPLERLGYVVEKFDISTALDIKIYRARISGMRDGFESQGVLLYWEYKDGRKDMTLHIV